MICCMIRHTVVVRRERAEGVVLAERSKHDHVGAEGYALRGLRRLAVHLPGMKRSSQPGVQEGQNPWHSEYSTWASTKEGQDLK